MLIKDLVHLDQHGAFRNDVQLSDYDNPTLNRELLRNYIFTVSAPSSSGGSGRDYSAKDVLDTLKTAFTVERFENRIVLTANYGQGKSHLALVLANLFGRPANSEEVRIIFERLKQALNNPPQLKIYDEFKQTKGEFLVIRLRGDGIEDLQDGFIRALEQALSEHDSTRGIKLPFWYTQAEKWLDQLGEEARAKVNNFLAKERLDVATLRRDLRRSGAYELVREAFRHLHGVYPDFGREVSLKDLVLWSVDNVCVPNKMGGLLILFDEFSLFLQKYTISRAAGKLQDLLNGISDRPGKSVFLAFTQLDIESVVETYAHGNRRDDVKKEIDRLPRDKRGRLFSIMEGVIDAYLKQEEAAWNAWLNRPPVRVSLVKNRETLFDYFSSRYKGILKWDTETAEKVVVRGCYPLHPLTTAILSSHIFEAGTGENPRTALNFVRDRWDKGAPDLPAEREDGRPNFIYATELVDFFGEQISKKWHEAYRSAVDNPQMPIGDEHQLVLKSLFLQQAVRELREFGRRGIEQKELLSHLSGLGVQKVSTLLRELGENRVILYDPNLGISSLIPSGLRSPESDKIIQEGIRKISVDRTLLDEIAAQIQPLTIQQNFGNPDDWAPRQVILTEEFFNSSTLKQLITYYRSGNGVIEESPRGLIIWLLARNEEEKIRLNQNAQQTLDSVLGENPYPLPVVIVLPNRPNPDLLKAAIRKKAFESFDANQREKIGQDIYRIELARAQQDFTGNLASLLRDSEHYADLHRRLHEFALPRVYLASIQTLSSHSIRNIFVELYRQAYKYRVDFSDKPVHARGTNQLRTAVLNISLGLFNDSVGQIVNNLRNQDMQYTVAVDYLTRRWGLLAKDTYTIQPPTSRQLREAWNRLEETFKPGCKYTRAKEVLLELLNPPYGHDYNTLLLLLAAWLGYHRHEIRLELGSQLYSFENFRSLLSNIKNPKDLLDHLIVGSPLTISRINVNEMFAEADSIVERIRQNHSPFNLLEAQQALVKLEQSQNTPNLDENRRKLIETYRPRLEEAFSKAQEYDQQASEWLKELQAADLDRLLTIRSTLKKLSYPELVLPSQPSPDALTQQWESRLERELDVFCGRYSQLKDLSEFKTNLSHLQNALKGVREFPVLVSMVENAIKQLNQRQEELQQAEKEKTIAAEINSMEPSAGLATLYKYQRRLNEIHPLSQHTEKLRQNKLADIQSRIQQFEQLAKMIPTAIENANDFGELHQQKNLLLRNLEQTQGTPLYQTLVTLQDKIERLENFFKEMEHFQSLVSLSRPSPNELQALSKRLSEINNRYLHELKPAQLAILEKEHKKIETIRQREIQKAGQWLMELEAGYKNGESPYDLLRKAQTPPAFLSEEGSSRLRLVTQKLEQAIEEDRLLKIETLFRELDPEARIMCLNRLRTLVNEL